MSRHKRIKLFLFLLMYLSSAGVLWSQGRIVKGTVIDTTGVPVEAAIVRETTTGRATATDASGRFTLSLGSAESPGRIEISFIGFSTEEIEIAPGSADVDLKSIILRTRVFTPGNVSVTASRRSDITTVGIPVSASFVIPSVSRSIEALVQTLPGVASYSELSNQYSVRGGSYDENLVYIDGIEIYRPYLIRYGQQEGLSQINPDFVSSVSFSPGGFGAVYGDRMSSVLDVRYRRPEHAEASATASLLTSSVHFGAVSADRNSYFMVGARYKTNTLLLKTLDEKGQFNPLFLDFQGYGGIKTGSRSSVKVLLSASSNRFYFIPESQTTTFGSIAGVYKMYAAFDGNEKDTYSNVFGALTFESHSKRDLSSKIILSGLTAYELEAYDIRGAYSLDAIDDTEADYLQADSTLNIGVGSWLDHARNRLRFNTLTLSYKGSANNGSIYSEWGVISSLKYTGININEWERVDSSGYTVGANGEELVVKRYYNNVCDYRSPLSEAYLTGRHPFAVGGVKGEISAGIRVFHDTFTGELRLSPRASLNIHPSQVTTLYLSGGIYRQPVAGRELMQFVPDDAAELISQKSYHVTAGVKYDFTAWDRPFRFTAEIYGKIQNDNIPYKVENVRISYFGGNIARGYSAGLDMRVNGEFVEGAESWFSLSLMKSSMEVPSMNTGWYPSPFDQRLNANIFFQDYLPGHPDFRAHINIVFGTGVPVSPQELNTWDTYFRMPSYKRIDLGFSKILIGEWNGHRIGKRGSAFRELSAGVEIFNLADINNTISYTWIRTVRNSEGLSGEYAVPNYLTRRRLNLRVTARF